MVRISIGIHKVVGAYKDIIDNHCSPNWATVSKYTFLGEQARNRPVSNSRTWQLLQNLWWSRTMNKSNVLKNESNVCQGSDAWYTRLTTIYNHLGRMEKAGIYLTFHPPYICRYTPEACEAYGERSFCHYALMRMSALSGELTFYTANFVIPNLWRPWTCW